MLLSTGLLSVILLGLVFDKFEHNYIPQANKNCYWVNQLVLGTKSVLQSAAAAWSWPAFR